MHGCLHRGPLGTVLLSFTLLLGAAFIFPQALSAAPLLFVQNEGQYECTTQFALLGSELPTAFSRGGVSYAVMGRGAGEADELSVLTTTFPGSNQNARIEPFDRLETTVSYFPGGDPAQWHPDVPVWGGVRYVDIYPGVDLEFTGADGELRGRFVAKGSAKDAAAAVKRIGLKVEGASSLALEGDALLARTPAGGAHLPLFELEGLPGVSGSALAPVVLGAARVDGLKVVAPFVSAKSWSRQSMPDRPASGPGLVYGTCPEAELGMSSRRSGEDWGTGVAVDGNGVTYLSGWKTNRDSRYYPIIKRFGTCYGGAIVMKLAADGRSLLAYAIIGGSSFPSDEQISQQQGAGGISIDSTGVYVTGVTNMRDFPTTSGAYQAAYQGGGTDAFALKLSPDFTRLLYSTRLGGSKYDAGNAVVVDAAGCAYVTGWTESANFPGATETNKLTGTVDAFVTKVAADGKSVAYSTYVGGDESVNGGSAEESGEGIVLDNQKCAYVTGWTNATSGLAKGNVYQSHKAGSSAMHDAYVAKINADGAIACATFLGGRSTTAALTSPAMPPGASGSRARRPGASPSSPPPGQLWRRQSRRLRREDRPNV